MFFGALLSAIKSCASATLLAPSVTFAENILKPAFKNVTDASLLKTMRLVVLCFTILVTLYSVGSDLPIYSMVENAYKVTLVVAFVPLVFGLYWKRANTQGAMLSIGLGLVSWIGMEITNPDAPLPPQLLGLIMSLLGMIVGSLMPAMGQVRELEGVGRAHPAESRRRCRRRTIVAVESWREMMNAPSNKPSAGPNAG